MLIYSAISLCVLKKPFDTYQQYIVLIFYNKDGDGEVLMEPFSYSVPFIKEDMREEVYYKLKPYYLDMLYKGESDKIDPTDFNIIHE